MADPRPDQYWIDLGEANPFVTTVHVHPAPPKPTEPGDWKLLEIPFKGVADTLIVERRWVLKSPSREPKRTV